MSFERAAEARAVNEVVERYVSGGYRLTLRQLYYRLVSMGRLRNEVNEYKRLGKLLTDARMCGIIDWDHIEDRLRKPTLSSSWDGSLSIMRSAIESYRVDRALGQRHHVEVWVEKDSLSQVCFDVTDKYGVPLVVNRGYSSTSAMHDAFQRIADAATPERPAFILYLGDHDPSGIDMVRDIKDRLEGFDLGAGGYVHVLRIGLTMRQITHFKPPPNPVKLSDSRSPWYLDRYGSTCWELDSLLPEDLTRIIEHNIKKLWDDEMYEHRLDQERRGREELEIAEKWLSDYLEGGGS